MAKKRTIYVISVTENVGGNRRILAKEYKTRAEAKRHIKKIVSPAKTRRVVIDGKAKTIQLTRYRDAQTGFGLNNPRIIKREVYR